MTATDYDPQRNPWYPPDKIIDYFELVRRQYGDAVQNDPLFKKAREMFSAAVALFGAYELDPENQYYMQINTQSASPDVMAAKRNKRPDGSMEWAMIQMEIVDMEEHAKTDDLVDFLLETKLSPHKAYSDKMMIICFINRKIPIQHKLIYERLKQIAPKPTIYVCGRPLDASMGTFLIFSAYPLLTKPLTYNINETAKKYSLKPRIRAYLGSTDTLFPTGTEYVNIYETLGLDKEKIYKKYSIAPKK